MIASAPCAKSFPPENFGATKSESLEDFVGAIICCFMLLFVFINLKGLLWGNILYSFILC